MALYALDVAFASLLFRAPKAKPLLYVVFLLHLASLFLANSILLAKVEDFGHTILLVAFLLIHFYGLVNVIRFSSFSRNPARSKRVITRTSLYLGLLQLLVVVTALLVSPSFYSLEVLNYGALLASSLALLLTIKNYFGYKSSAKGPVYKEDDLPSVSILVPARDETQELLGCLQSLVELEYKKLEIIVLDDCSTNSKTSETIKSFARQGVRFVAGAEPGKSWLGKNNANETLRQEANSEWLLFLGSDMRLEKKSLKHLVSHALSNQKSMVSVMPLRSSSASPTMFAPARYWWEFVLPRKLLKRPAVLSSTWLIQASKLDEFGGFKGVSRSILPERYFAKFCGQSYKFLLADRKRIFFTTTKPAKAQTLTATLHRYPQLRRRVEAVAVVSIALLSLVLVPVVSLGSMLLVPLLSLVALTVSFAVPAAVHFGFLGLVRALFTLPLILREVYLINNSMYKYEFSSIYWKGRNVCLPIMRVTRKLPALD